VNYINSKWGLSIFNWGRTNPDYGFLWWLNQNKNFSNAASKESIFALGVGRNLIWVDPTKDLVVVVRWLEKDAFEDSTMKVMDLFG